jgi:hypothetical protein
MRAVALITLSLLAVSEAGAGVYADETSLQTKTITREEFQKLYVYIDAAIASGDAKQLAVVALPGAEIRGRTGEDRRQFSAFIAAYKAGLPKGSRIICRSTIQDVQLSGDTAVILVRMELAVVPDSGRPARVFDNLDTWTMTVDGWKLNHYRLKPVGFLRTESPLAAEAAQGIPGSEPAQGLVGAVILNPWSSSSHLWVSI